MKSARGGKGGIVASAAAFWSAVSSPPAPSADNKLNHVLPPGQPKDRSTPIDGKDAKIPQANTGFRKSILPLDTLVSPSPPRRPIQSSAPHFANVTFGVPAAGLINGTVAKPVLSSSASLAKHSKLEIGRSFDAASRNFAGAKLKAVTSPPSPSSIPTSISNPPSSQATDGQGLKRRDITPVGRDRLRELISRYQNPV